MLQSSLLSTIGKERRPESLFRKSENDNSYYYQHPKGIYKIFSIIPPREDKHQKTHRNNTSLQTEIIYVKDTENHISILQTGINIIIPYNVITKRIEFGT